MSLNLYAEPVKPLEPYCLGGHPVKGLLCKAFGDHDGSLVESFVLTAAHTPILGVLLRLHPDCAEDLAWLIDALEEHTAVRLWTDE